MSANHRYLASCSGYWHKFPRHRDYGRDIPTTSAAAPTGKARTGHHDTAPGSGRTGGISAIRSIVPVWVRNSSMSTDLPAPTGRRGQSWVREERQAAAGLQSLGWIHLGQVPGPWSPRRAGPPTVFKADRPSFLSPHGCRPVRGPSHRSWRPKLSRLRLASLETGTARGGNPRVPTGMGRIGCPLGRRSRIGPASSRSSAPASAVLTPATRYSNTPNSSPAPTAATNTHYGTLTSLTSLLHLDTICADNAFASTQPIG